MNRRLMVVAVVLLALALPGLASADFVATGSMVAVRGDPSAVLLPNGRVLVAGGFGPIGGGYLAFLNSAETYDSSTGTFASTGSMTDARQSFTATLLATGKVLVAGGFGGIGTSTIGSAELYDPASATFSPTGSMNATRAEATATLLPNGKVLIVGGISGGYSFIPTATAELYDPSTGTFTLTGSMSVPRFGHTATLLSNGNVLVAGGDTALGTFNTATAELYDPSTGTFTPTGLMSVPRFGHTATPLGNGTVLIAGGFGVGTNTLTSAELYDPVSGSFLPTGSLATPREGQTATLLSNGQVLLAGGQNTTTGSYVPLASAEVYDPGTSQFSSAGNMSTERRGHTATLLPNGSVLIAAGTADNSAELFVTSPAQLLANLLAAVTGVGPGTSLADKVNAAQAAYAAGDVPRTCEFLNAFINQVKAQTAKKSIVQGTADALIADATRIQTVLGC